MCGYLRVTVVRRVSLPEEGRKMVHTYLSEGHSCLRKGGSLTPFSLLRKGGTHIPTYLRKDHTCLPQVYPYCRKPKGYGVGGIYLPLAS
jgi:hypothetical protein